MNFQIISLFPKFIESYLSEGVIHQALKKNLFRCSILNPRDFATDLHRSVDDRPFGGSDGMVLMPEILEKTLDAREIRNGPVIYLSPQGKALSETKVSALAKEENLTLLCGRYGGIDQRALNAFVDEEVSIGDYVISGGELAALVLMDAVVRKLPGSLGHLESSQRDSFADGYLEAPLFTRPQSWKTVSVPSVLTSGHHKRIQDWEKAMSWLVTLKKRPDLYLLNFTDQKWLYDFYRSLSDEEKRVCNVEDLDGLIIRK